MFPSFFKNPSKWFQIQYQKGRLWYAKKKQREDFPLPKVTHPYNATLQKRQSSLFFTLFISIVLVGVYSYLYIHKQTEKYDLISVYTAKSDLKAPKILTKEDVILAHFPRKNIPQGAFTAWGPDRVLVRDVVEKSLLTRLDVQQDVNPASVSNRFEDSFAFAVDEGWFEARFPNIHRYDHVDIISGNPVGGISGTSVLVSYGEVLDLRTIGGSRSLTLQLSKSQAQSLLFARSLRLPLQILVYPSGSTEPLVENLQKEAQPAVQTISNTDDLDA